ncbi:hypothetical protein BU17DRAFT_64678 [Hysterangium stoloniferum]|nr:hypothetical protein BU17DRAFT_64678 [Hysterangium stoloniferum]
MADDANRAAKAARAKAMASGIALKKRQQQQQQKVAGSGITPSASPAPVETPKESGLVSESSPMEEQHHIHRDTASLFAGGSSPNPVDFGEFGVISPSPTRPLTHISPPPTPTPQPDRQLNALVKNQQQTISLLVAEKASLVEQLHGYDDMRTKLTALETQLAGVQAVAESVPRLQKEVADVRLNLVNVEEKERAANDKARDMEHALSAARVAESETKKKLVDVLRELRELKEDDRGEMLERSLEASRGRVEELEARVGKLVQALDTTNAERSTLKTELDTLQDRFNVQSTELLTLAPELATLQSSHSTLQASLDSSEHARASLEASLAASEASLTSLQHQLASMATDLATHARHVHDARAEADNANHRASDSEGVVRALQVENAGLMDQLGEMRPKLVELSNARADDEEKVEKAERRIAKAEKEVVRLEGVLEEIKAAREDGEEALLREREGWRKVEERYKREVDEARAELEETQIAHATLAKELDDLGQKFTRADLDNASQRGTISTARQEVTRWRGEAESRLDEIHAVKKDLEDMRLKEEETLAVVARAQAEVEALQDQLALREDELTRLREEDDERSTGQPRASLPHSQQHRPGHSLSDEMTRHDQTLDLSNAHSRIRALETALYDAEHSAERRIQTLEAELAQARARSIPSPSLAFPRRFSYQLTDDATSRRHSLSSSRPHTPSALRTAIHVRPRAVYDKNLSADTRHKRKVSLNMLKARIESERASGIGLGSPRSSLSKLPLAEVDEKMSTPRSEEGDRTQAAQFLEESHVFWCHSCSGDLVVL